MDRESFHLSSSASTNAAWVFVKVSSTSAIFFCFLHCPAQTETITSLEYVSYFKSFIFHDGYSGLILRDKMGSKRTHILVELA